MSSYREHDPTQPLVRQAASGLALASSLIVRIQRLNGLINDYSRAA
jgi:hypothetical protein